MGSDDVPAVPSSDAPSAVAGWYPDPFGAAGLRYWDGQQWTPHEAPVAVPDRDDDKPGFLERRRQEREQRELHVQLAERQRALAAALEAVRYAELPTAMAAVDGVVLKKDEVAHLAVTGAGFFEARRQPGQWVGGSRGVSFRIAKGVTARVGASRGTYNPGQETLQMTDRGLFVVTDRRCMFIGTKRTTEWAYSKLVGFSLEGEGVAVFNVSNRQKASGVAYGAEAEARVDATVAAVIAKFQGAGAHTALLDELSADVRAIQAEILQLQAALAR